MMRLKTILHATDFSPQAEAAFQLASSLARDHMARLVVLHVAPVPANFTGEGMITPPVPTDLTSVRERLCQIGKDYPSLAVHHLLSEGDPVTEIIATAKDNQSDMIVIGTHGRSGLSRLLLGSVAEQVVRKAPCAVVTIKAPLVQRPESTDVADSPGAVVTNDSEC